MTLARSCHLMTRPSQAAQLLRLASAVIRYALIFYAIARLQRLDRAQPQRPCMHENGVAPVVWLDEAEFAFGAVEIHCTTLRFLHV
jgi:hypothetical protein